jgi:phosphate acetyltransferase
MLGIIDKIRSDAALKCRSVVLPEAQDERILRAAIEVNSAGIARPILLGSTDDIQSSADALGLDLQGIELADSHILAQSADLQDYLQSRKRYAELSSAELIQELQNPLTLACCLLATDEVDACVAGAVYTTTQVIQNGLRIVGTSENSPLLSSFFLMVFGHSPIDGLEYALFADCAINVNPDAGQLAQIVISTAASAKNLFGLDPKVAVLSFSTAGSATHPDVDKVQGATRLVRKSHPQLKLIGEVQFDAAIASSVRALKMPEAEFSGPANVYVFPDLDAGNISAKVAERIGGAMPVGPVLQGLRKPLNDLSRGADIESIINTIAMTCLQVE